MQSIIVYRNPLEAMLWQGFMDGSFFPIIVGVVVFFAVLLTINKVVVERYFGWSRRGTPTNVNLAVSAAIAIFIYSSAVQIGNHPFIEFAGVMTAYVKTCRRAHEEGIDFTECNRHSGRPLPMESFEVTYLKEKLDCIFDGRIAAVET